MIGDKIFKLACHTKFHIVEHILLKLCTCMIFIGATMYRNSCTNPSQRLRQLVLGYINYLLFTFIDQSTFIHFVGLQLNYFLNINIMSTLYYDRPLY